VVSSTLVKSEHGVVFDQMAEDEKKPAQPPLDSGGSSEAARKTKGSRPRFAKPGSSKTTFLKANVMS
jgi:hypothetical protein